MTAQLTIESRSGVVLDHVASFMHGLGYHVETDGAGAHSVRIALPDATDDLLEVLSHIALSATKANVDLGEPMCRVTYHHTDAATAVTLAFRLSEFAIGAAGAGA
jgi:hypothetical protein